MEKIHTFDYTFPPSAVAVGKFDAFHKGHINVFRTLTDIAKNKNLKSVIISFLPSPYEYFSGISEKSIFTNVERDYILQKHGINIDIWVKIPFDKTIAELSAKAFVDVLTKKVNCKHIVAGMDFCFGHNRKGKLSVISACGVTEIIFEESGNIKISSGEVRKALSNADFAALRDMLGFNWFIVGEVKHGKALGRKLGFPTANLAAEKDKLLPPDGVYLTETMIGDVCYNSITNVGRSDVANERKRLVETHILGEAGDIYDREITVQFIKKQRDAIRFATLDELKKQLLVDIETAKEYFNKK